MMWYYLDTRQEDDMVHGSKKAIKKSEANASKIRKAKKVRKDRKNPKHND